MALSPLLALGITSLTFALPMSSCRSTIAPGIRWLGQTYSDHQTSLLGSAWESPAEDRGIVFLEDGDLDEVDEVIPWRGETRAGDRDPTRDPSLGDFLRLALCNRETTSAPESLSAGLVSV